MLSGHISPENVLLLSVRSLDEVLFLESQGVFRRMTPDNLWLRLEKKDNQEPITVEDWDPEDAFQHEFLATLDKPRGDLGLDSQALRANLTAD